MSRYCPKCGKKVSERANHCRFCGQKLRVPARIEENITPINKPDQNKETDQPSGPDNGISAVQKSMIAFAGTIALILIMWYVSGFSKDNPAVNAGGTAVSSETSDPVETATADSTDLTQIDMTGYLDDVSVLAEKTGAHRTESQFYDIYYETDDGALGMMSEWESGPVMMMWFSNDRYTLFGASPKMKMDEAVSRLSEYGWEYSDEFQYLARGDYVIELFFHSDEDYKNQQVSEIVYGNFAHTHTGFVDDSFNGESPIGYLTVNVDELRVRKGPSLDADNEGTFVNTGDYFDVYETAYSDGYTWYRIGAGLWIASDGTYVTYIAY